MRRMILVAAVLLLAGCDGRYRQAEDIVRAELGNPAEAKFQSLKVARSGDIVCGEVIASDKPLESWRFFVAYIGLKRAAVSPTASKMDSSAERGNPLLAGAAEQFYHTCD